MQNKKIPVWLIIACFVFGAWPIGVILIIIKAVKQAEAEEKKKAAEKKNAKKHTVYHSAYGSDGDADSSDTDAVEPNTTYHYSYVKKELDKAKARAGASKSTDETSASKGVNYVKTKFKRSGAATAMSALMWFGIGLSVMMLLSSLIVVAESGLPGNMSVLVTTMAFSTVTAVFYMLKEYYKTRDYRIATYLSLLRRQRFYSIEKLAEVADVSVARTIKDLQYMQSKGLLGADALIDKRIRYVILTTSARDEAIAEYERKNGISNKDSRKKEEPETELSDYEKTLLRIRALNDDIDDPVVSDKIETIEELTRKIFKLVEEKPVLRPQIDSFLSYYLPTTMKLLDSYAYFEEQGVRGENIDAGMKNIEETLDMLIVGYRTQLDKLFQSQALDVSTDINVLEQMMKADGFTKQNDFGFSSSGAFAEFKNTDKK